MAQKAGKPRRRRLVALWSHALIASAPARPPCISTIGGRAPGWESQEGFIERRVTVRRVTCAACGQSIPKGNLTLRAYSGDAGRTPFPRFLHLEACTGDCPNCRRYPCQCRLQPARVDRPVAAAGEGAAPGPSASPHLRVGKLFPSGHLAMGLALLRLAEGGGSAAAGQG